MEPISILFILFGSMALTGGAMSIPVDDVNFIKCPPGFGREGCVLAMKADRCAEIERAKGSDYTVIKQCWVEYEKYKEREKEKKRAKLAAQDSGLKKKN